MSVYIKGMEMPTSCLGCALLDYAGAYKCRIGFRSLTKEPGINISRPPLCPLIPVPDHGRLVDADALKESIKEARKAQPEIADVYDDDYFLVAEWLASAPTIIPGEEVDNG